MKNHYTPFFLMIVFLIFLTPSLNAQNIINDTIILNNGNTIIGKIKNHVPNEFVKIDTKNGMFFFQTNDILKLCIHTSNFDEVISTPNKDIVPSTKINDDVYTKIQYPDTVRYIPVSRSKYNDYVPLNIFLLQSSLEISTIYKPFDVTGQAKFQAIYTRRFIPEYAFGVGACLRYVDYEDFAKVFFIDIRTIVPKGNSFTSVSIDPGIVFYRGNAGLNLNIAYNHATRIQKNLFFTIGFDINYQSNTNRQYSTQNGYYYYVSGHTGSINPGVVVGIVF